MKAKRVRFSDAELQSAWDGYVRHMNSPEVRAERTAQLREERRGFWRLYVPIGLVSMLLGFVAIGAVSKLFTGLLVGAGTVPTVLLILAVTLYGLYQLYPKDFAY